ncbi:hypothetical protein MRX96_007061 [Rhipicephalus microplus]
MHNTDGPQLLVSLGTRDIGSTEARICLAFTTDIAVISGHKSGRRSAGIPKTNHHSSGAERHFLSLPNAQNLQRGPLPAQRALRRSAAIKALLRQVGAAGRRHDLWLLMTEANGRSHMTASGHPRRRAAGQRRRQRIFRRTA